MQILPGEKIFAGCQFEAVLIHTPGHSFKSFFNRLSTGLERPFADTPVQITGDDLAKAGIDAKCQFQDTLVPDIYFAVAAKSGLGGNADRTLLNIGQTCMSIGAAQGNSIETGLENAAETGNIIYKRPVGSAGKLKRGQTVIKALETEGIDNRTALPLIRAMEDVFDFRQRDGTQDLVAITKDDIFKYVTATNIWTSIEGAITISDKPYRSIMYNNVMISTNNDQVPLSWSGAGNATTLVSLAAGAATGDAQRSQCRTCQSCKSSKRTTPKTAKAKVKAVFFFKCTKSPKNTNNSPIINADIFSVLFLSGNGE